MAYDSDMAYLKVSDDRILSITDARTRFNQLVDELEQDPEGLYVLTKTGTPAVAVVNIQYLEQLLERQASPLLHERTPAPVSPEPALHYPMNQLAETTPDIVAESDDEQAPRGHDPSLVHTYS
jgi:hypothetical protein